MADDKVLVLPANLEESVYRAFIHTSSHCYEVCVLVPSTKLLSHARVEGDWRLNNLLRGQEELVQQHMSESRSVAELLHRLRDLLTHLESTSTSSHVLSLPLTVCRQLAKDIDALGWTRVQNVDTLFRHIKVTAMDKRGREHILTVLPTAEYPQEPPSVLVEAPMTFEPHWSKTNRLCELVDEFTSWLDSLELFWSTMEELDSHTCILEPEHPTRSHAYRRILIGTHLSLLLHVDPHRPLCLPEPLQFLGPDQRVSELKDKVWRNSAKWVETNSLLANLQALLETEFPQASSQHIQEMSEECGICYDYRLNGVVPSVICPNSHCAKSFHSECFQEWLRGLPRGDGLHTAHIIGECPFCGQVIRSSLWH